MGPEHRLPLIHAGREWSFDTLNSSGGGGTRLLQAGERFDEQLLRHLSPLDWEHINLTGDYLWSSDIIRGADGMRPLILSPG